MAGQPEIPVVENEKRSEVFNRLPKRVADMGANHPRHRVEFGRIAGVHAGTGSLVENSGSS